MKTAECFSRFYAQIHGLEDLPLPSPIHIKHPHPIVPKYVFFIPYQPMVSWSCFYTNCCDQTSPQKGGQNHQAEDMLVMCVKQCYKPPVTGNGKHTTYKNGDFGGMVMALFYPHCIFFSDRVPNRRCDNIVL